MRSGPGQLGGDTSQQQPRKVREILDKAKSHWLKNTEVVDLLSNYRAYDFRVSKEAPVRPSGGSLFLFNRRAVRFFRKDGHNWRKKADGKTVRETHEKLKIGNKDMLNCYYAHAEEGEHAQMTLQRRCYWMLEGDGDIVLVHYLVAGQGSRIRATTAAQNAAAAQARAMGLEQPLPGLAAVHGAAGHFLNGRGPTGVTSAGHQALSGHPPQQAGTQLPQPHVLPHPQVPRPQLPQHQPLQQHRPHFQPQSQHQQQAVQESKPEPQKAPAAQQQHTEPEHALRPEQMRESQQHQGALPATLQSLQALSQQQGGQHQPPPPSSAELVHRHAISLPPASPQAQLPEQPQLQLLPSADEQQTLAMSFGAHGRPTTPQLTAALTSLVGWDQVLFSGNPLEGLVQMVNNYAQDSQTAGDLPNPFEAKAAALHP